MQDYRKLAVWRKSHELAVDLHRVTTRSAVRDHGGLISQLRRSAISIPANIAEGCGKEGSRELGRYLQIAIGSASELEYHLLLAKDLDAVSMPVHAKLQSRVSEVLRMLVALRRRVATSEPKSDKSTGRRVDE
jgi:four helix bundle protein